MESKSNQKLAEKIFRRFEKKILDRQLNPGDRLPSERELQEEMKISRGTIREAYRTLKQKGYVESRRGGGTFVQTIDKNFAGTTLFTMMQLRGVSFEHIQEFRESVESKCAARAVECASEDQVRRIRYLVTQLKEHFETNKDSTVFYELELNIHAELSRITENPLYEWFTDVFARHAAESSIEIANDNADKAQDILKDWHDFVDAMERKQVILAMEIMSSHIVRFRRVLRESKTHSAN